MSRFQPGQSGNPNGRPKGTENKYTIQIKEAFGLLLEGNLENLSNWLAEVAADDPKAALDIMMRMSERFVPKLRATEITGAEGQDLFAGLKFNFGPPIDSPEREDD